MSGITDEAAVAEHDLIQHAEDDLSKVSCVRCHEGVK